MNLCIFANSIVLISNMIVVFFKIWPKFTKIRHSWIQRESIFVLDESLHFDKFDHADLEYGSSFFKFQYQSKKTLAPNIIFFFNILKNSRVLILSLTIVFFLFVCFFFVFFFFIFGKFDGANLEYGNSYFKFCPKSYQIKHFSSSSQSLYALHETLHFD